MVAGYVVLRWYFLIIDMVAGYIVLRWYFLIFDLVSWLHSVIVFLKYRHDSLAALYWMVFFELLKAPLTLVVLIFHGCWNGTTAGGETVFLEF